VERGEQGRGEMADTRRVARDGGSKGWERDGGYKRGRREEEQREGEVLRKRIPDQGGIISEGLRRGQIIHFFRSVLAEGKRLS
jgi:hypothetical protein